MSVQSPLPVIVNVSGGTARSLGDGLSDRVREAFAGAGRETCIHLVTGDEVGEAVREGSRAGGRVVVGGGDGTLGTAAGILADSDGELAILPLGTRNHLARQLEIPLDLDQAAKVAAHGALRRIDVGRAGKRTFINNASFGAYIDLLRERDASRFPHAIANLIAGLAALNRLRPRRFDLEIDGVRQRVSTAQLFVGNNRYEIPEGHPGKRRSLDDGLLSIFALEPLGRLATLKAGLAVARGSADMARDFALDVTARELRIDGQGTIEFALDGERHRAPLPLELTIRPGAVAVVTPPA